MAESPAAPKKVSKTYLSKLLSFSCAWTDENNKKATIQFFRGSYTTDDADRQAHIEGLDGFGKFITLAPVAPSPKEAAAIKAKSLRAVADEAAAAAESAEKELAAVSKPAK